MPLAEVSHLYCAISFFRDQCRKTEILSDRFFNFFFYYVLCRHRSKKAGLLFIVFDTLIKILNICII